MTNTLTVAPDLDLPNAPVVTPAQLDLVRRTVAVDATDEELQLFLYDCARRGVHPLDKLLHFTKRGGRYVPITSIDYLRSRAHLNHECGGIDDAVFSGEPKTPTFTATVTAWRITQGQRCPYTATARWEEYLPPSFHDQDAMWKKMPHVMLAKVAEALALRKAFPAELSGLYAKEELDQANTTPDERPASLRPVVNLPSRAALPTATTVVPTDEPPPPDDAPQNDANEDFNLIPPNLMFMHPLDAQTEPAPAKHTREVTAEPERRPPDCPHGHGAMRWRGGVSKKTGKEYGFYGCSERECSATANVVNEKQRGRLWHLVRDAYAKDADAVLKAHLSALYGIEHGDEITDAEYETICASAQARTLVPEVLR